VTAVISPDTVKICSLRQPVHAEWVVEAGANLFGLIFANARRQVSIPVARQIVDHSRALQPDGSLRSVGVFVEQSIDEINRTADEVGLDLIQLHRPDVLKRGGRIERPVILVVHAGDDTTVDSIAHLIESIKSSGSGLAGVAVDAFSKSSHGGTGAVANWTVARQISAKFPTVLAGGLHTGNVDQAIAEVGPTGVDVSSGVETDGEKDRQKIVAFVKAARRGFLESVGQVDRIPLSQATEPVEGAQPLL
jgi:phosphoribosylanthranilate isomerase